MNLGFINAAAGMANAAMQDLATASAGRFVVNKDNVLAAAKIIQSQVTALKERLRHAKNDLMVVPPGGDIVSGMVAEEWNKRLILDEGSYAIRVQEYVDGLDNLVIQLRDSAMAYGYNEDEVATALGTTSA